MRYTTTVVIGAGHCGLAMSRCLAERVIDHVVLERGEVANSWRTQRWDSLRLLTPNWMTRLPGYSCQGDDPDGYRTLVGAGAVAGRLRDRVRGAGADRHHGHLGPSGTCGLSRADRPTAPGTRRPSCSRRARPRSPTCRSGWPSRCPPAITTLSTADYRNPGRLPDGRSAGGRRLGQRGPDRRGAAPLRTAGDAGRRRARPDAPDLPGPRHPVVDGRRRACSTSATTRCRTCSGRAACRRCSWSAPRSARRST